MKILSLIMISLFVFGCTNYGPNMPLDNPSGFTEKPNNEGDEPVSPPIENHRIVFENHILPIFDEKCSLCHYEDSGVPDVLDYNIVIDILPSLYDAVIVQKRMPMRPYSLTADEFELIRQWIEAGSELPGLNE